MEPLDVGLHHQLRVGDVTYHEDCEDLHQQDKGQAGDPNISDQYNLCIQRVRSEVGFTMKKEKTVIRRLPQGRKSTLRAAK